MAQHYEVTQAFSRFPVGKAIGYIPEGGIVGVNLKLISLSDAEPLAKTSNDDGLTIDQVKNNALATINDAAQSFIDENMPVYPDFEKLTFTKQEDEARAYIANNTIATPVLSPIATARGIDLPTLAQRVVTKADALTALSSHIAGQRQAYEDQISTLYAAGDKASILALKPAYSLPQ